MALPCVIGVYFIVPPRFSAALTHWIRAYLFPSRRYKLDVHWYTVLRLLWPDVVLAFIFYILPGPAQVRFKRRKRAHSKKRKKLRKMDSRDASVVDEGDYDDEGEEEGEEGAEEKDGALEGSETMAERDDGREPHPAGKHRRLRVVILASRPLSHSHPGPGFYPYTLGVYGLRSYRFSSPG